MPLATQRRPHIEVTGAVLVDRLTSFWDRYGRITLGASAVSSDGVRLDAFVRGTDGALWHAGFNGTTWSWEGLGAQRSSAPSAASSAPGRIDVVARSRDRSLWHIAGD